MAGRFERKRKRVYSSSTDQSGDDREITPMPDPPMDFISDRSRTPSPTPSNRLPAEETKKKKNYRYVYDLCFYDITGVYFYLELKTFKKVHLSVCRYMNACLKRQEFILDFFVSDDLRRSIRRVINNLKILIKTLTESETIECLRFWKVKRVQIAKAILDCVDKKLHFFECTREVEKILYNGLCYASLKETYSDKLYNLCLFSKLLYSISLLDYDKNK